MEMVTKVLDINIETSYYVNLGNDRPNITYRVQKISGMRDYKAVEEHFKGPYRTKEDIQKTMIFVDDRMEAHQVCKRIRSQLPKCLRRYVDFYHAYRAPRVKREILRKFRRGRRRVLVCTEAAGMVRDL